MANVPHTASNGALPRSIGTGAPANRAPFSTSTRIGGNKPAAAGGRGAQSEKPAAVAPKGRSERWSEPPSARIKSIKCADPFASKSSAFKTKFGGVFNAGGIPARLQHGAVKVRLQWSRDPASLDYDPLLVTCAEGLLETEHPYAYASRACFGELLAAEGGGEKAAPLVARIVPSLRAALLSSNKAVFDGGVVAATQLSEQVGDAMNEHIHVLVVQMNKRSSDKELAPKIMRALQTFEELGGAQAYQIIKAKVPTFAPSTFRV
eukprot:CAMPEP_0206255380 /NCGR_PEP_ID=MMETSP0047_2-20121206/24214_1 /ASSEMBLY_ACC=CAM_ASM_000192 /TAXON_ID=195065 /ORGANISM="Chroomonas mesostigmatica_cf, Strain CCMP1168" /LENGTH=262 /DNA_ID=CAMNT_0053681771 /DNA_START=48 /DNA_END=833 /DNA_ORIENTATION=-